MQNKPSFVNKAATVTALTYSDCRPLDNVKKTYLSVMKVALTEMNDLDYKAFKHISVPEYMHDKVRNGEWDEETAEQKSQEEYDQFLPQGLNTPGHYFRNIVFEGRKAGYLWFNLNENILFVYNIRIYDHLQSKGIGGEAMKILKEEATKLNAKSIKLHVFGFNKRAVSFYKKIGFEVSNLMLELPINN